MSTAKHKKRQSQVASMMRWPLTFLVVLSHSVVGRTLFEPVEPSLSPENVFRGVEMLAHMVGLLAVCCFGFISGYYFFAKAKPFDLDFYIVALKKRGKSLLVPYVLWNLLTLIVLWSKNEISLRIGFDLGYSPPEVARIENNSLLTLLLLSPLDGPLWYIRDLFCLVVLSPLIALGVRYGKALFVVAIWLLYALDVIDYLTAYFVLGAYLAMVDQTIFPLLYRGKWGWFILLPFFLILALFRDDVPYFHYLYPITIFGTVMSLFYFGDWIVRSLPRLATWFDQLGDGAFFTYAIHMIAVLGFVRGILYLILSPESPWEKLFGLPLTAIGTMIVCYMMYWTMKRIAPNILELLTGGRV